ncbi:hypothetical protein AL536_19585 [Vibrio fluvialis]|uniref:Polysaccharide biosynthesis protein n=1 Tax=Vibrio fluvialis TaxID=676 RepID=A0AAX2LRJ4_VIBFL|nr:hypothetical protein [Vibrio fluvialis]AMF95570.1 hypothetical protein AL536_19585 [Vibrio fluvialis]EKO3518841.1 hypothetical protein [Vibrio fluvialis]EKO4010056.1 hypothetical protein [Vibrio fluvialis]MBY8228845.1 hypothetical protein [Vibrio fluvialis]MCE7634945.1 hypothetical protein [Vibrio fluvialis]
MFRKLLRNKELLWTVFAQFLQMSSGVVLIKLLTSNLSLTSYGTFSLVMAASAFVLTVPFTALQQGFYRYRSTYIKKNKGEELYSSMIFGISTLVVIYVLISYVISLLFFKNEIWYTQFFTIAFFVSTEVIKIYVRAIVNADRKRKLYSLAIITEFSTKLLFVAIYFNFPSINVLYIVLLYAISNTMSIMVCMKGYISHIRYIPWSSFWNVWKKTLTFSAPLLIWAIFGWSRDSSLRWIIETKLGTSDVAVFTAITSIAVIVPLALQSLVSAYIIPILYQNDEGKNRYEVDRKFSRFIQILYLFGFIGFVFLIFYSDIVIELFTDEKYLAYSWALPWAFISYYLFCCAMLNGTTLLVQYDTKSLLYPNLLSGIVIPFVFFIYGENFSFKLAIASYFTSYLVYFLSTTIIVFKSRRRY